MVIRNDIARRRVREERDRMADALVSGEISDEELRARYEQRVVQLDADLAEYEELKAGGVLRLVGEGANSLGEILIKARVARGLTMAELGEVLDMTEQQVGRYEKEGWRRAGLYRIARAADALGLTVNVEAVLGPRAPLEEAPRRDARAASEGAL